MTMKAYTPVEIELIVRMAGHFGETSEDAAQRFAEHLAAHAAVEHALRGTVTQNLAISARCPYCGQMPPGWTA